MMKKKNESLVEAVLGDYADGQKTVAAIAKQFDISTALVSMWAKEYKLPLRGRGCRKRTQPTPRQRRILALAACHTYAQVGKEFGHSKSYVGNLMKRWCGPQPKRRHQSGNAPLGIFHDQLFLTLGSRGEKSEKTESYDPPDDGRNSRDGELPKKLFPQLEIPQQYTQRN